MGKIFYSLAGEGRGHATRVKTVVEDLRKEHEIHIYAPHQAYELLAPVYKDTEVKITEIPGLIFKYTSSNRMNYLSTVLSSLKYLLQLPSLIKKLSRDIKREEPDLVITDFEPALPRAAKRCKIPFISFDHQNFLRTYDLRSLPFHLKWRAWLLSLPTTLFYSGQMDWIVSSFYFPPKVKRFAHVHQIGVLLRKEVVESKPKEGDYILAYFRRFTSANVIAALKSLPLPVRIYGLGSRDPEGNLSFYDIDAYEFIQTLAQARALISTAGNQVIGEALFLEKPVLAMPETGNFEQEINGHFLQNSGAGISIPMEELDQSILNDFVNRLDFYRENIDTDKIYGNPVALEIINEHLNRLMANGNNKNQHRAAS